jgi:hypothetical protein
MVRIRLSPAVSQANFCIPPLACPDLDASAPMKRRVPPAGWRYSITSSVLARIVCGIVRPSNPGGFLVNHQFKPLGLLDRWRADAATRF